MKKFLFAAFAIAAVLSGCVKDDLTNGQDATVVMNAPVFYAGFADASSETKTYVNENGHLRWNADDRLTIFVGKTLNTQYAFDGEDGDNAGGFNPVSGGSGFVTANPLSANYAVYPYSSTTKISEEGVISLSLPEVQAYGENSFGRGANTMVAVTENKDDYYLPFKNVCGYLVVSFYGDATIASVSLEGNNGEKLAGAATVTPSFGGNPSLVMKDTATETITIDCGEGVEIGTTKETATAFWFVVPQTTFSNGITITATSKDGESFQKATSKTITIERNKISTMSAVEVSFESAPAIPEMVDLGLPSGIKWASFNLGASSPEEYGGYYQWGGLEDVSSTSIYLDWSNCPFHTGSSSSSGWTKYIPTNFSSYWSDTGNPDNKTVLDPEDDVAHVKLGGKWRMPTEAEWQELRNNCTWTWTTQDGVNGYKVTGKKSGYTDKSIFLPAAGGHSGGEYWSSSLNTDYPSQASTLYFASYSDDTIFDERCLGNAVRPVSDEGVIHVTSISLNKSSVTLSEGSSETLTATIYPSNATNKNVTWSSDRPFIATVDANGLVTTFKPGSVTITAKTQDGGYTATCNVSINVTEVTDGEMIDLGLPSGIKWAACNLGASLPEDYGGLYQWAGLEDETDASTSLNWNNCPYHTGSSTSPGWTKYIPSNKSSLWSGPGSPDNKTILDPEDDVAHVKLGGSWRMPTKEDFEELIKNCTSEWIPMWGFYGRKFTSKNNGNSIFLPAAGYRSDFIYSEGFEGYYWSSSLNTDYPIHAYPLNFTSDGVIILYDYRYLGLSVRPVCE